MPKKKYDVSVRKNWKDKANYKRINEKPTPLITLVGYDYVLSWINKNGNKDDAYIITSESKNIGKFVWNKEKGWHSTGYEQELNENNTVKNRTSEWLQGNMNEKGKVQILSGKMSYEELEKTDLKKLSKKCEKLGIKNDD